MNLFSLKHFSEHGINFVYQLFDKNGGGGWGGMVVGGERVVINFCF